MAPLAVAGVIVVAAWLPGAAASATPGLAPQSVGQLVGRLEEPAVAGLSGTIEWRADLGLPDMSALGGSPSTGGFNVAGLLSGTTEVKVWQAAAGQRLALIGRASEIDLYSDRSATWFYDSQTDTATRLAGASAVPALTPRALVAGLLGAVPADMGFSQGTPRYVAGRPCYTLVLAPRPRSADAAGSTLGAVSIAIDASSGAVLRVSLTPAGGTRPELSAGFTSVRFAGRPDALAASMFRFTPPAGTRVEGAGAHGARGLGLPLAGLAGLATAGHGWSSVVILPGGARLLGESITAATTVVRGPFGTARLLSTGLINALFLPGGDVAAGFVTPAVLEAAVARHS